MIEELREADRSAVDLAADDAIAGASAPRVPGRSSQVRDTRRPTTLRRSAREVTELTWHEDHAVHLTRGERAADRMRNVMGSWPFVGGFIVFMGLWAVVNTVLPGWDVYPFILLNLFLSMLAGLQGAILLIAAKRQDAIAAALARHDYETNFAAKTEIETLLEINRSQMELIKELRELVRERLGA